MSAPSDDLLAAALDYAAAGLPVFPLKPRGKAPLTVRGFHDASADVQRVAAWWDHFPDASIGVPTGAVSGYDVLDVDVPAGLRSLAELERKHGKLVTAQVLTGTGGRHYWFKHSGGELPSSVGRLGPGLDVRGDGGYVVAPPSVHENGNTYQWTRPLEPAIDCPTWLLEDVEKRRNGPAPAVADTIPQGERDATLASLAGTMRRRGMGEPEILAALRVANETRCDPPLPDRDVERIARSIARYAPGNRNDEAKVRADEEIASAFARARGQKTLAVASVGATAVSERLTLRNLDTYRIRQVEWLDKPVLQRSAFHLLAGRKGTCKGTWTCWLAARVTRGDLYEQPKRVLVITSEDSVELDFLPRLVAASGDRTMVEIVNGPFRMPADLEWLKEKALDIGDVGLIVIDPIGNHLGGADTDKEGLVREAIAPLNEIADELDCMILGIRHLGKDSRRGALASVLGSTAWVDVPRCVILMAADNEDDRLYHAQVVAGNRGPRSSGRAFRLELVDAPPAKEITLLVPEGMSSKDVEDLLGGRAGSTATSRSGQARGLVLDILENEGEQESDALDARIAQETGIAAKTIRNLRGELKNEGLIGAHPDKDQHGTVTRWLVRRTHAPRTDT